MNDGCIDVTQVIQQHDFDFFTKYCFHQLHTFAHKKNVDQTKVTSQKRVKHFMIQILQKHESKKHNFVNKYGQFWNI